ncbi:20115_t:CDS:2 [Funneliformis geosporum]|uniref:12919_t:CDS:1 n=1 Tax=Funneliformis geosporum TaxID=1117311 RepID=A0A9W4WPU4_9GLOM|nr:12919_t:CDS:2 [Funneliformis geosporum]CAI2192621.1 20115_t:CDS:2 [Funneliformis geosporum]
MSVNDQNLFNDAFSSYERPLIYLCGAQQYHIIFKEIPPNDLLDDNSIAALENYVIIYYHFQIDLQKTYEVHCRKIRLSHPNKLTYSICIELQRFEQHCQYNFKEQLETDLTDYLTPNKNSQLNSKFIEGFNIITEEVTGLQSIIFSQIAEDHQFQYDREVYFQNILPYLGFQFNKSYEESSSEIASEFFTPDASYASNECESESHNVYEESSNRWGNKPTILLLGFLKVNKDKVRKLQRRGSTAGYVRESLWLDASDMLQQNKLKFSDKQCAVRYKNIKQNYNKGSNTWKTEIEEIIDKNFWRKND